MDRKDAAYCVNGRIYEEFSEVAAETKKINEDNTKIRAMFIQQMEHTCRRYGFTKPQFAEMLGTTLATYYKWVNGERAVTIDAFLTYCRFFGFDISEIVGKAYLDSSDSVLRELMVLFSGFSDETIDNIKATIENSSENDNKKQRAELMLDALKNVQSDKTIFYRDDMKNI